MAATFTTFLATATDMAQVVAQEPAGFAESIDFRPGIDGANLNQTVNIGNVSPVTGSAWSPGIVTSLPTSTETGATLVLDQAREFRFDISGEQLAGLNFGNALAKTYLDTKMAECMRGLRNEVEIYLAALVKRGSSRAVGTAGTTPFASNMDLSADLRRVLIDNGCPASGLSLVVNSAAGANVRKQLGSLTAAAGSQAAERQRDGGLPIHNGFQIRESAGIITHTKGTGASYVTSGSTAVGTTGVALVTGTGTVLAGDVVTFAADANNAYVVGTGVAAPGTISLNRPGARAVIATANALTVGNNYTPNMALHRSAVVAVVRPPAQADGAGFNGGSPFGTATITDEGGKFTYGLYAQAYDGGILVSVRAIWGGMVANPHLIATLMG